MDLWGRVRNEVSSAKATRQASAADYASVELSLRAQLAEDYFNLRAYDAEIALYDRTVESYREALKLTTDLFNGGAAALADVAQAQAQLDNALTQAADFKLQRAQAEHAIAVLVGENPSLFDLAGERAAARRRPAADRYRTAFHSARAPAGRRRGRTQRGRGQRADRRRSRGLFSETHS